MNLWLLKRTIKQSCLVVALLFMGLGIGFSSIKAEEPPTIHFDATNHNYGVIAEDKGEAIHQFIFRNEGNSPLVITRVTADCGCTTPNWPTGAIMPGDSGRIGVAYDPLGRPGPFVKKVVVYSNAPASPTTLTIKGSVSTLGGVERGTYAIKIGSAEFSSDHLNYPTTSILSRADLQLTVNNPTEKAIQVRIGELPKYVQIDNPSRKLEAFEPAEFSLSLNPNGIDHPGIYTDELAVIVTEADGSEAKGTIKLSAVLVDDFSGKDFQNAPRLELRTYFDFGQISPDRKAFEQQIELKNVGAETLIIHTTESQEAAIQVVGFTPGLSIAPQESKNLTLRINPSVMQKEGKTSISSNVAILCNAPSGPLRYIKVKLALQTI